MNKDNNFLYLGTIKTSNLKTEAGMSTFLNETSAPLSAPNGMLDLGSRKQTAFRSDLA